MQICHKFAVPLSRFKHCRARLSYGQKLGIVQEWRRLQSTTSQTIDSRAQSISSRMLRKYMTDARLQIQEKPQLVLKRARAQPDRGGKTSIFAHQSAKLFEELVFRRKIEGRVVTDRFLQQRMLKLVRQQLVHMEEALESFAAELLSSYRNFQASNGWLDRWKRSYRVSQQRRTQKKSISTQVLVSAVREFHRMLFALQASACKFSWTIRSKYGRFRAKVIWNVVAVWQQNVHVFKYERRAVLDCIHPW